ncbi:ribonuclease H-like domain-containing protein [Tanacetum coccineum]
MSPRMRTRSAGRPATESLGGERVYELVEVEGVEDLGKDLKKEITLGTGSEFGGLYLFDMEPDNNIGKVNMVVSCYVSKDLWHNRLGHPADQVLNGPYRITSREGFKYFLTVVDDFSRDVWVYLIKIKDEVFDVFINMFLCDMGIIQQTSCAHTPQQDGIAERKHRHLLNVARSLMFQEESHLRFWSECVLTVVYLINRLPTFVLNGSVHDEFRRSYRVSKLSAKLNDYAIDSKLKEWLVFIQLVINNALWYVRLVEDVYMDLPLGYDQVSSGKVFKLNKSLYRLKQASRQWNAKLTAALIEHGFVQSKFDYSLYTKESSDVFLALLVYVDDIVITGNCKDSIDKFKMFLKNKFMIKDLGILKYFMAKPATTSIPENIVLSFKETENDKLLSNITKYQKMVGKLIYLTHTRPDISYDVQCLSQYMHALLQSHLKAAIKVLRKSVSGFCVMIGKCPVSWKSKKQPTISRSSAEFEYRCLAASTCEVIWICNVLSDFKVTGLFQVDIFCDSSSAIQIASNPVFYEKRKHFEIDVHIV